MAAAWLLYRVRCPPATLRKAGGKSGPGKGLTVAWPTGTHPFHPENAGKTMTDADRKTLAIYPMDLGGQYWARQNTGFVPFTTGDPVNPSGAPQ